MKRCPFCNKPIEGRSDKVFCDDRCRNNYYYRVNSEQKSFIRDINSKLLKNRGILRSINSNGRDSVPKSFLEEEGFDFQCFTGIYKTKKGKDYYLVYDQAYSVGDDGRVQLVVFYRNL
ncbi:MAG: hypothetical protein SPK72_03690 [Bacteroidales bacterium]|jgi:hypothetical protein|nr:hypothetical protein [Bacteroidales bacterium]